MKFTAQQRRRLRELIEPLKVKPGTKVRLPKDYDPAFDAGMITKKDAAELHAQSIEVLAEYQSRLAAQDTYGVLVILQAIDAAGKDSTIRHVMSGVNPQGVSVHSFKVPSMEELNHDYLWRYAQRIPARGEIGIFNRSYYEEVLVVRVHQDLLVRHRLPRQALRGDIWQRRYREINDWERYFTDNGFRIVKLFLNLSKEEQRRRFLRRLELPDHNWKFSTDDVQERAHWDEYQKAFSEMLSNTSSEWAPWWVIPADHKWLARIAATGIIIDTLAQIDPRYPVIDAEQRRVLEKAEVALKAEAPGGAATTAH